jgi:hypothetical protein
LWPYLDNIAKLFLKEKRLILFNRGTSRHAPELLGRASFVTLLEKFRARV